MGVEHELGSGAMKGKVYHEPQPYKLLEVASFSDGAPLVVEGSMVCHAGGFEVGTGRQLVRFG